MTTQFTAQMIIKTGCSRPNQTDEWQNTRLYERPRHTCFTRARLAQDSHHPVRAGYRIKTVTAEKADIGSSHFLLTVQIVTGRQSLSAYLLANTRALHLKASKTYHINKEITPDQPEGPA